MTTLRLLVAAALYGFWRFGTTNAWTMTALSPVPSLLSTHRATTSSSSGNRFRHGRPSQQQLCALKATTSTVDAEEVSFDYSSSRTAQTRMPDNDDNSSLEAEAATTQYYTPEQKFTNLVVLSIAFGYAFYTILSIDAGTTRGWSAAEIAMRIPLDNWGAYESYLENKPIVTKSLINVIIYLLGDWLSQTAFSKRNVLEFDLQRTLRNGFIGLCFGPLVHEYYEFSDWILPPELGLVTRLQKILMDQTIYLTAKCCLYISAVGLLAGETTDSVQQTVKDKIQGIVVTAWKFWPIVHCVTYSVIPAQHRVLWVNSVDLVWNAILSSAAQKEEQSETEAAETTTTGSNESCNDSPTPTTIDRRTSEKGITRRSKPKKNIVLIPAFPAIATNATATSTSNNTAVWIAA